MYIKIKITGLETLTDRAPEIPDRNSYKTQLTGVNDLWRDHGKQSKIGLKLQTNLFDCLHFYYIFLIFSPHPHSFANAEVAVTEIRRKQERLVLQKLLTIFLFSLNNTF